MFMYMYMNMTKYRIVGPNYWTEGGVLNRTKKKSQESTSPQNFKRNLENPIK